MVNLNQRIRLIGYVGEFRIVLDEVDLTHKILRFLLSVLFVSFLSNRV